jgi:hypothetical protein
MDILKQELEKYGKITISCLPNGKFKVSVRNKYYNITAFPEYELRLALANLKLKIEKNADVLKHFRS